MEKDNPRYTIAEDINNPTILSEYDENIDQEGFKEKYAGVFFTENGKRLSKSSMKRIWNKFIREQRIGFFESHSTFTVYDIVVIGVDKFVYTMGWTKPSHVANWRNNKVRIGICCHCTDQFIPLMFQSNHGLCNNCRPLYSVKAMRNYVLRELEVSQRYKDAHRDMLMDFYIMFYHDEKLRKLFLKDSELALQLEALDIEVPEWVNGEAPESIEEVVEELEEQDGSLIIDAEFYEVPEEDTTKN